MSFSRISGSFLSFAMISPVSQILPTMLTVSSTREGVPSLIEETVSIVGNICETGDIIAKDRKLPEILENDILGVLDSGAYGYSMSSNYNSRLRPDEVLIEDVG